MSKLANSLKVAQTPFNNRYPSPKPLVLDEGIAKVKEVVDKKHYHTIYEVHTFLSARFCFHTDEQIVLEELIKQSRQSIIEEVFGEFRKPLYEARRAVNERDFTKANEILSNTLKEMFDV